MSMDSRYTGLAFPNVTSCFATVILYDTIMQTLFWSAIIFWLSAYFDARNEGNENLERKFWHPYDHTLIAEGFFTMATILAFLRVLLLLQLNFQLGSLQVALQRIMTEDILKFFIILLVVVLAFTAGLCKLYNYYDGMIYEDKDTGTKTQQVSSFVNFWNTLNTLFWAIFCMSPIESADVIIENIPAGGDGETVTNAHGLTQAVGYICLGMYSILVVFVIVNMMIAELCNTMQKVVDNVNVEWIFGRSVVHMSYMNHSLLPPPFNLLPTSHGFVAGFGWLRTYLKPEAGKSSACSFAQCCYVTEEIEEERKSNPVLMASLCKRYLEEKEEESYHIQEKEEHMKEMRTVRKDIENLMSMQRSIKRDLDDLRSTHVALLSQIK